MGVEGFATSGQPPMLQKPAHVDHGEQRTCDAALRRAAFAVLTATHVPFPVAVPLFNRRFQPQHDQPQHVPINDAPSYRFEKIRMRNRVERTHQHNAHLREIPPSVKIIRKRHAFEGQSLQVIRVVKRRQVLLVLVVLPDQSRSLIPASWTDWEPPSLAPDELGWNIPECFASVTDLRHTRAIVDALLMRRPILSAAPIKQEESHADCVPILREQAAKAKRQR